MRVCVVLALCCFIARSAFGQTNQVRTNARSLKLEECIDLALARNLDIQIQRLSTDVAAYTLGSSYGPYDPILSFFARRDLESQPAQPDPSKRNSDLTYEMWTDSAGPSLRGNLPIGLDYQINGSVAQRQMLTDFRFDTNDLAEFPTGFRHTNDFVANAGITAHQHLLRDSWIDQQRMLILTRRKDFKISEEAMRFQVMQTILAVELAYYDVIAAQELVQVQEKALQIKQQFLAETRRKVEVGDLPPLETEQAETQLEITQTALTSAREMFVDRQNALKRLVCDDFRDLLEMDVTPSENLAAAEAHFDRAESFKAALKNRPDLAQARLAVERGDVEVRFARNQLFPSLDLFGHYGSVGVESNGRSAISDALHFREREYSYGLIFTVPLTSVRERNDYRSSQVRKEIAQLQLKRAEQDLFLQIADFVNRVESRFSQVGSTRRARSYAEAALAAEEKKLANGLSTTFVVLQFQETLTAARTAEVQALADYNKTLAQLAFAEGVTLEKHRIEMQWQ